MNGLLLTIFGHSRMIGSAFWRAADYRKGFAFLLLIVSMLGCAAPLTPTRSPAPTQSGTIPFSVLATPTTRSTPAPQATKVTPVLVALPSVTPSPSDYADVDALSILTTLFPSLRLSPSGDIFVVNDDPKWTMWVNSRAEGHFTDMGGHELTVIVASEAPGQSLSGSESTVPWGSFLAVLSKDGGLHLVQRADLFPVSISPLAFDVKIDRGVDFDHDDQDELLITTTASRLGITTKAGFLYRWANQSFSEVWSASLGEDNTAALNQAEYYSSTSEIRFADLDGVGIDAIIVDTTRSDYALGSQGLPELDREIARRVERRVYRWIGNGYAIDPTRATPFAPPSSATP